MPEVAEHREPKEREARAPARSKKLYRFDLDESFYDKEVLDALRAAESKKKQEAQEIVEGRRQPTWEKAGGRYLRLYELGHGGMGAVDLALDEQTGRLVVVKRLLGWYEQEAEKAEALHREVREQYAHRNEEGRDPVEYLKALREAGQDARAKRQLADKVVARYRKEIAALAKAGDNPFIVKTHEVVELPGGGEGIVMEYVKGSDLYDVMQREQQPTDAFIASVIVQVCLALAGAHEQGVLHRDIKLDNIFVEPGEHPEAGDLHVRVGDFGVARLGVFEENKPVEHFPSFSDLDFVTRVTADHERPLTEIGSTVGTPLYMAPESITGHQLKPRTDLYSLGVMMYRMVAGRFPFEANGPYMLMRMQVTEEPKPPHEVDPDGLASPLEPIIMKLLIKNPEERYQTALEVAREIRDVMLEEHPELAMKEPYIWLRESTRKASHAEKREVA